MRRYFWCLVASEVFYFLYFFLMAFMLISSMLMFCPFVVDVLEVFGVPSCVGVLMVHLQSGVYCLCFSCVHFR